MTAPATLTGLAIGDSLGMPFEMAKASNERLRAWNGFFEDGSRSPYTKELGPGQWTDDTKMAKALAESMLEEQAYSPTRAAKKYLEWFRSGDLRGIGTATFSAMRRLDSNVPWTQSGKQDAEGNGTAMRAAPIGLFYHHNFQAVLEMARIDADLTHRSHEARVGSMAVAGGVAAILQGIPIHDVAPRLLDWLPESRILSRMQEVPEKAERLLGRSDREVADAIAEMGAAAHVVETVPAAFLAVSATTSFASAVRVAILCGGDTDTTAAVAGALAGTFYGYSAVSEFIPELEAAAELRQLEEALFNNAPTVR